MNICESICPCNQCNTEPEDCKLATAYEKGIPKPPKVNTYFYGADADGNRGEWVTEYECPDCGEQLDGEESFCPACGMTILTDIPFMDED